MEIDNMSTETIKAYLGEREDKEKFKCEALLITHDEDKYENCTSYDDLEDLKKGCAFLYDDGYYVYYHDGSSLIIRTKRGG